MVENLFGPDDMAALASRCQVRHQLGAAPPPSPAHSCAWRGCHRERQNCGVAGAGRRGARRRCGRGLGAPPLRPPGRRGVDRRGGPGREPVCRAQPLTHRISVRSAKSAESHRGRRRRRRSLQMVQAAAGAAAAVGSISVRGDGAVVQVENALPQRFDPDVAAVHTLVKHLSNTHPSCSIVFVLSPRVCARTARWRRAS